MNDVPSDSDKTGLPAESAPGVGGATTKVSASQGPESDPAGAGEERSHNPDATRIGALPYLKSDAPTMLSGDATVVPGTTVRRSPSPEALSAYGSSPILLQTGAILGSRYEILELL